MMSSVMDHATADTKFFRNPMTDAETAAVNNNLEVFAAGAVESIHYTTCIEGVPGESRTLAPAMQVEIRDGVSDELHVRTIPLSRVGSIQVGQEVRLFATRRGWANHILTWHVLPAIH